MNDTEHYVLLKTIKTVKDKTDRTYTLGNDDLRAIRDKFLGYLQQLVSVVNELYEKEEKKA
jgi:hypothetical protein